MASAKFARKAGYSQTAYSSNLQAAHWKAPYAYIESCKLLRSGGDGLRALQELDNTLKASSRQIEEIVVGDNGPVLEHKDAQKLRAKARSSDFNKHNITNIEIICRLCSSGPDGCTKPSDTLTSRYAIVSRSLWRHLMSEPSNNL
jgi:hypothetical protein